MRARCAKAIEDANAAAGADTIAFNVSGAGCDGSGVCTIAPVSSFRGSRAALIDGFTQPGSSPNTNATGAINAVLKIVVSGQSAPGSVAFHFNTAGAADSTVRGLVINGGFTEAVRVWAPSIAVRGCFLGTDASGLSPAGNGQGVYADAFFGATGLSVGGPAAADRNLIASQTGNHVICLDVPDTTIQGNLLGTDKTGAAALGILPQTAIAITAAATGETVVRNNVVAGGSFDALQIADSLGATVTIVGNFIGTDSTGTVDLGNPASGIRLFIGADDVRIGGTGAGEANVIAFNGGAGVMLYPSGANGPQRCTIRGNSIHSNDQDPASGEILGIDLGEAAGVAGLTENDLGDGHGTQRSPELPAPHLRRLDSARRARNHDHHRAAQQCGGHPVHDRLLLESRMRRPPPGLSRGKRPTSAPTHVTTDGSGNADHQHRSPRRRRRRGGRHRDRHESGRQHVGVLPAKRDHLEPMIGKSRPASRMSPSRASIFWRAPASPWAASRPRASW